MSDKRQPPATGEEAGGAAKGDYLAEIITQLSRGAAAFPGYKSSPPEPEVGGAASDGFTISTTRPDELNRHDISDEELTMLVDPRRDEMSEEKWGFAGLAAGALPAAFAAGWEFFDPDGSFGLVDLVQIIFVFVGGALAFYIHKTNKRLAEGPTELAASIRARTKRKIQHGGNSGK